MDSADRMIQMKKSYASLHTFSVWNRWKKVLLDTLGGKLLEPAAIGSVEADSTHQAWQQIRYMVH